MFEFVSLCLGSHWSWVSRIWFDGFHIRLMIETWKLLSNMLMSVRTFLDEVMKVRFWKLLIPKIRFKQEPGSSDTKHSYKTFMIFGWEGVLFKYCLFHWFTVTFYRMVSSTVAQTHHDCRSKDYSWRTILKETN